MSAQLHYETVCYSALGLQPFPILSFTQTTSQAKGLQRHEGNPYGQRSAVSETCCGQIQSKKKKTFCKMFTLCFICLANLHINLFRVRCDLRFRTDGHRNITPHSQSLFKISNWTHTSWKVAGSIPDGVLDIFIDLILRPHYGPWVDSASNINECQESTLGG